MMLYGGFHGINLSKVTVIVVWIFDFEGIYGVDFNYSTEVGGKKFLTLGLRGPFSDSELSCCEPSDSSIVPSRPFSLSIV